MKSQKTTLRTILKTYNYFMRSYTHTHVYIYIHIYICLLPLNLPIEHPVWGTVVPAIFSQLNDTFNIANSKTPAPLRWMSGVLSSGLTYLVPKLRHVRYFHTPNAFVMCTESTLLSSEWLLFIFQVSLCVKFEKLFLLSNCRTHFIST